MITTTFLDYPDNISQAVIYYFSGCDHFCKECQNPDFQKYGKKYSELEILTLIINNLRLNKTNKVVLSGGDPLYVKNFKTTVKLVKDLHSLGIKVCIYTGFDVEFIGRNYLKNFDFIKCGKFDITKQQEPKKTDEYLQFASSNQKLYDGDLNLLSIDGRFYFKG